MELPSLNLPDRCALAVSGGADSVAMLRRVPTQAGHAVVHIDHETRAGASAKDANFVRSLCDDLGMPCVIYRRSDIEPALPGLPKNKSARFRAVRLAAFADCCTSHGLVAVVTAHHRLDQAETVLLRLLRGSGFAGWRGMQPDTTIRGVRLLRPMLQDDPADLRAWLTELGQPWREDASNADRSQRRNLIRPRLREDPTLAAAMVRLAGLSDAWWRHLEGASPRLGRMFHVGQLASLARDAQTLPFAEHAARRWLTAAGTEASDAEIARLIELASDAASPPAVTFSHGVTVRRRRGEIFAAG